MELCPSVGFEPSTPQNHPLKSKLRSVLHTWSKGWTIHAHLLLTTQLFCFIDKERNRSLKQKLTSVLFIVFDNFFKVNLFYTSLLLWNMNAICWISSKKFITYPKHSQIPFLTDTLAYTVFSRDLRIHLCM